MNGKVLSTERYLSQTSAQAVTLTFSQVEEIVGDKLPPSAFTHRAWWANDKRHVHAVAWMTAKRAVGPVDIARRVVTFAPPL